MTTYSLLKEKVTQYNVSIVTRCNLRSKKWATIPNNFPSKVKLTLATPFPLRVPVEWSSCVDLSSVLGKKKKRIYFDMVKRCTLLVCRKLFGCQTVVTCLSGHNTCYVALQYFRQILWSLLILYPVPAYKKLALTHLTVTLNCDWVRQHHPRQACFVSPRNPSSLRLLFPSLSPSSFSSLLPFLSSFQRRQDCRRQWPRRHSKGCLTNVKESRKP